MNTFLKRMFPSCIQYTRTCKINRKNTQTFFFFKCVKMYILFFFFAFFKKHSSDHREGGRGDCASVFTLIKLSSIKCVLYTNAQTCYERTQTYKTYSKSTYQKSIYFRTVNYHEIFTNSTNKS